MRAVAYAPEHVSPAKTAASQCCICTAGTGGSPAFIADSTATEAVWQYMMPKESVDSEACPKGHGSGLYFGHDSPRRIVAVVGTAHVRGMVAELEKLSGLQSP